MLAMKPETYQTEKGKVVPKLPSFWLPSLTPGARETEIKPPNTKTVCPMSGNIGIVLDVFPGVSHARRATYTRRGACLLGG